MVVVEKCTVTWLWRMCCAILINDNDILLCVPNMHESMVTPLPFVRSCFVGCIAVYNYCLCLVVAEKLHMVCGGKIAYGCGGKIYGGMVVADVL